MFQQQQKQGALATYHVNIFTAFLLLSCSGYLVLHFHVQSTSIYVYVYAGDSATQSALLHKT